MRREQRLTRTKDFATVYRKGRALSNRLVVLRLSANGLARSRYGIVAGRAIGKAVVRNRLKRRLREAIRSLVLGSGWDIVIIARRPAADADYDRLRRSVAGLLRKAGVDRSAVPGSVEKEGQEA